MEFLDQWRAYFETSGSDIFTIIEQAIAVASRDDPRGLASRRDRIVGLMFDPKNVDGRHDLSGRNKVEFGGIKDGDELLLLRLKNIFENHEEKSDDILMESLNTVKSIPLTAEILTDTLIGKAVNGLRTHRSTQIRTLSTELVRGWKSIVIRWLEEKGTPIDGTRGEDATEKTPTDGTRREDATEKTPTDEIRREDATEKTPTDEIRREDVDKSTHDEFPENVEDFEVDEFLDSVVINDLDDVILNMEGFRKNPTPIYATPAPRQRVTLKVKRITACENQNDVTKLLSSEEDEKNLQHKEKFQITKDRLSKQDDGGSKATHSPENSCKIGKATTTTKAKLNETPKQKPSPVQKTNKSTADNNKGDLSTDEKMERTKRKLHELYKKEEGDRKRVKVLDHRHLPSQCIKDTSKRTFYTRRRP